jgi:putative ABC transport system permease protein
VNTLRFAFVNFARDWKSGEQAVMAMALLVAVAALTAIAFFTNRISLGVEQQAGEVLAADIRVESPASFYEAHALQAAEQQLSVARTVVFPSVVMHGEQSSLAALRAVSSGYPLRGRVKLARTFDGAVEEVQAAPASGEAWADARLLAQLSANVGDTIELGRTKFTVTRVLIARPDQGSQFVDLAPGVIFSLEDLPATELIKPGSRASYALLFAGAPTAVTQLRESMDRAGSFLNLASMVSVLLSAIAVAMAARRYAARRMDVVALMKSMGASQARVLTIYLTQLLIIAVLASVIGTLIGFAAQEGLAWLLKDLLRGELPAPTLAPVYLGVATAFTVLMGFALPPLLQLKRVPPIRVLRRDVEAPPLHYLLIYGLAIGAVIAVVATIVQDAKLVQYVIGGLALTFAALYLCGWLLVRALSVVRGRVGVSWRYGVANIARRGRESVVQIIAFGLGLMVLLLLVIVRNDLLNNWRQSLPSDAPNQFIINIQPTQVDNVRAFFVEQGLPAPIFSPMASARMTQINDEPIAAFRARYRSENKPDTEDDERRANDNARNASERQANLSWVDTLPEGNKVVQGKWWSANDGGGPRVSVEVTTARSLHVKVGDRITYDFAGEAITATIANLREVKWDSFKPNYFIVFSPGVIDHAVGTYITSMHVPTTHRATMREFMRRFPEVTAIDIDVVLSQVRGVMDKVSLAVEYVSAFTLLAGITVLFAAIQATRDERRYESAMLRTLGASRRVVLLGVAAEFGVLGILSGVLAATGATLAGYLLASGPFNLEYSFDPLLWSVGLLAGVALVGVTGTAVTYSVVNAPPIATLRKGA